MTGDSTNGNVLCRERSSSPKERTGIRKWARDNLLLIVTVFGVVMGTALGFGLKPLELSQDTVMLISYPGELFMRLLKLIILPLIVSSLISGSASLNARMNGRIALRTLVLFLATSMVNALLGIALAVLVHPGHPNLKAQLGKGTENRTVSVMDSMLDIGRNIFPDNLFQATFQQTYTKYESTPVHGNNTATLIRQIAYRPGTNTLGIVFFCLVFGTILGTMGKRGRLLIDFFQVIFDVIMKMVTGVMWLTPIGVSSVIAGKILSVANVTSVISQLFLFIITVIAGVFIYQLIIMQLLYFLIVKKNPFKFYFGLTEGVLAAFATASTAAALPITFRLMKEKVKLDPRIFNFVLPIGCNINMDGTALFVAVSSIFIAQMNGTTLKSAEYVTVFFTSTAASLSSASVPSAALVLLLVVLTAINTPVQDVSLLFTVDWILDRFRTTNNMLGDCYTAAIVEHLSKKELMALDAVAYQEPSAVCDPDSIVVEPVEINTKM